MRDFEVGQHGPGFVDHADGVADAPPIQPAKYGMGSSPLVALRYRVSGGPAGRSLTGAPGHSPWRFTLLPVVSSRHPPCGGSHPGRSPESERGRHGGCSYAPTFSPRMRGEKVNQRQRAAMSWLPRLTGRDVVAALTRAGGSN